MNLDTLAFQAGGYTFSLEG